jgi:transposase
MDFEQIRTCIKLKFLEGKKPKIIHEELQTTLGDSGPSITTVYKWINEFKRGRERIKDEHRSGRSIEISTENMIQKVTKAVEEDGRISCRVLADRLGIGKDSVRKILIENLKLKKIQCHWVPYTLNAKQKAERLNASIENLAMFLSNKSEFLDRLVTQDETWVHHYEPLPSMNRNFG